MPYRQPPVLDLERDVPRDPYERVGLEIFELAFRDYLTGNGHSDKAEAWLQTEACWELAKIVFGPAHAHVLYNWARAGFPKPEEARKIRSILEREIPNMDISEYDQMGVPVEDCTCGGMPQVKFINSVKVYLECNKCGKKTGNHMFVMEAADEWEEINVAE